MKAIALITVPSINYQLNWNDLMRFKAYAIHPLIQSYF